MHTSVGSTQERQGGLSDLVRLAASSGTTMLRRRALATSSALVLLTAGLAFMADVPTAVPTQHGIDAAWSTLRPIHADTSALAGPGQRRRPNIVLITSDDQADYDMRWMPKTRRLIGRAGVTFTDAVSPHPLCCPARAQILTGQYAHNNGVRTNAGRYGRGRALRGYHNTIARWLHDAGYRTGFSGKFLHHYSAHKIRPRGWDQWHPLLDARGLYRYYHYAVEHNGRNRYHARMHKSDFLARQSVRLVRRFHRLDRPFFIWQSHLAPHGALVGGRWTDPVPAYRHRDELRRVRPPSFGSPAFMEANMRDKPRYLLQIPQPSVDRLRRRFTRRIRRCSPWTRRWPRRFVCFAVPGSFDPPWCSSPPTTATCLASTVTRARSWRTRKPFKSLCSCGAPGSRAGRHAGTLLPPAISPRPSSMPRTPPSASESTGVPCSPSHAEHGCMATAPCWSKPAREPALRWSAPEPTPRAGSSGECARTATPV